MQIAVYDFNPYFAEEMFYLYKVGNVLNIKWSQKDSNGTLNLNAIVLIYSTKNIFWPS